MFFLCWNDKLEVKNALLRYPILITIFLLKKKRMPQKTKAIYNLDYILIFRLFLSLKIIIFF